MRVARVLALVLVAVVVLSAACDSAVDDSSAPSATSSTTSTTDPPIADGLIQSARFAEFYFGAATGGEPTPACPQPTATVTPFTTAGELALVREWVELPRGELEVAMQDAGEDPGDQRLMVTDPEVVDGIEDLATCFCGRAARRAPISGNSIRRSRLSSRIKAEEGRLSPLEAQVGPELGTSRRWLWNIQTEA